MIQDLRYGGYPNDNCVNRTAFTNANNADSIKLNRFGTGTFGDCTNARNDATTPPERGYLYNWAAVMQNKDAYQGTNYAGCTVTDTYPAGTEHPCKGLCPTGFHVPTWLEFDDAYNKFSSYYGCSNYECWNKDSQWEGVIGGMCHETGILDFADDANYWGSTQTQDADNPTLYYADFLTFNSGKSLVQCDYKNYGFALRCVSSQVNPPFSAGSITTGAATVFADVNPTITIGNSSDASGGDGSITYEWRRSGTPLTGSNSTSYSIDSDPDNYSTPGTYTFTRWAKDGACAYWVASSGIYTLTVEEPIIAWTDCSSKSPGFTMISNRQYAGSGKMNWNEADAYCKGIDSGWRLPSRDELICICNNKGSLPGGSSETYYWSSTPHDSDSHHTMDFFDCDCDNHHPDSATDTDYGPLLVKCVK
jgi:uncharacterized protein (TIGR02145 family)